MNTCSKKLLTAELKARLREVGNQNTYNPLMIAKFYNPAGRGIWFLSDYIEKDGKYVAYYMDARMRKDDWIYITEDELEGIRFFPQGACVERDVAFTERRFSELASQRRR
jgi:hypothetical protein